MERDVILEVQDLCVNFYTNQRCNRALRSVSFALRKGRTLCMVGESGCGKSTTLMAISRLERITAGRVLFEGRDLAALKTRQLCEARMDFQLIFQDPYSSLDPRMRAIDIVAEPLRVFKHRGIIQTEEREIRRKAVDLLDRCGLSSSLAERYPHEFSGGQRQRIGIARALALGPKLILADEPVSALDVSIQSQILNLLKDLQAELDLTFLFVADDLAVIEFVCNRVAVMYLGSIVELASSRALNMEPLHPYTKALLSAVPIPDPVKGRSRQRTILKGDVPSPAVERTGCPFVQRCEHALPRCRERMPLLVDHGGGHAVACFLYGDQAVDAPHPTP